MTYYESAEGQQISRRRVLRELVAHGLSDNSIILTFDAEVAISYNGMYDAQEVLRWLGY